MPKKLVFEQMMYFQTILLTYHGCHHILSNSIYEIFVVIQMNNIIFVILQSREHSFVSILVEGILVICGKKIRAPPLNLGTLSITWTQN